MIIHKDFVIGHIPRTGGDATLQIFNLVREELGLNIDSIHDHGKHRSFAGLTDRKLILGIRCLPSWLLSYGRLCAHHGVYPHYRHMLLPETRDYFELNSEYGDVNFTEFPGPLATLPDRYMKFFTDGLEISHWLRVECLREDILDFLKTKIHVSEALEKGIMSIPTKASINYNHDVDAYFTAEQITQIYKNNPMWAEFEAKAYDS